MKKIIQYIKQFRKEQYELKLAVDEIEFANKFRDSIKSVRCWQEESLFVGNWAGNYAFFYVISRILQEFQFQEVVEFGLGESSKFISGYLQTWLAHFNAKTNNKYPMNVVLTPLEEKSFEQKSFTGYKDLSGVSTAADFYIVDGPFGSDGASRCDIIEIVEKKKLNEEFIIIIDDIHREGENYTFKQLIEKLQSKGFEIGYSTYIGKKTLGVIATPKFKFALSF